MQQSSSARLKALPTHLSKYTITSVIGEGAMGVVYKATDTVLQRQVAIKTLHRHLVEQGGGPALLARFRNEALAAARLMHPSIVAVHDYGEHEDEPYIVMEFVEGHTLSGPLRKKTPFEERDLINLMRQLLEGLHYAHEQGVWHRDIKPSNLLLFGTNKLKIADFGIARIASVGMTQLSSAIGTPGHMAPEQYSGDLVDRRADIFAAGVILYVLLCHRPPFVGSNENVMFQTLNSDPLPPSRVHGSRSAPWFDDIVAKAMAKRPEDRYATAQEFKEALVKRLVRARDLPQAGPATGAAASAAGAADAPAPGAASAPAPGAASAPAPGAANAASPMTAANAAPLPAAVAEAAAAPMVMAAAPAAMRDAPTLPAPGLTAPWFDEATLSHLEGELSQAIGPMAKVLVRRAARATQNIDALRHALAGEIDTDAQREHFMRRTLSRVIDRGTFGAGTLGGFPAGMQGLGAAGQDSTQLGEKTVRRAETELARFLGPIAKVVVSRAAAKARSRDEFMGLLTQQLADQRERDELVQALSSSGQRSR